MSIFHRPAPAGILFIALFASQAGFLVLTPILPDLARDLGVSTAAGGSLRMAGGLAGGIVALSLGGLGRRAGLRDLLAGGLALVALGCLMASVAPTFAMLAASQLAVGAGNAVVLSAGIAASSRWSTPEDRTRVLSWTLLGPPAAWVAGMPLIGALAGVSWRLAMLFPVAAGVAALAVLATRRRDEPATAGSALLALLRTDRAVATWATGELLAYAAWTAMLTFAGALLVESYGASAAFAGGLLGVGAVAYFPGNLLVRRRLARNSAAGMLPALCAGLASAVFVFGAVRPGVGFSTVMFAVLVFLGGGRTLAGGAAGLEVAPQNAVAVSSIRAAAMQLGIVAGAPLGGAALAGGGYALFGAALALTFLAAAAAQLRPARCGLAIGCI